MKNRSILLTLFSANTGKTTHTPKSEPVNPFGYQVSRVNRIKRYGRE